MLKKWQILKRAEEIEEKIKELDIKINEHIEQRHIKELKILKIEKKELDLKINICLWCLGWGAYYLSGIKTEEDIIEYIDYTEETITIYKKHISENPYDEDVESGKVQLDINRLQIEIDMLKEILNTKE